LVKREKDRWWEVRDPRGEPVCVTVYERGAVEVVRRLQPDRAPSVGAVSAELLYSGIPLRSSPRVARSLPR
jgi:hypothetical protein